MSEVKLTVNADYSSSSSSSSLSVNDVDGEVTCLVRMFILLTLYVLRPLYTDTDGSAIRCN